MVDGGLERKAKKRERTFVADVALRTMRKVTCEGKRGREHRLQKEMYIIRRHVMAF